MDFVDTSNENISQELDKIKAEAHAEAIDEVDDYTDDYDWGRTLSIKEPNKFYGFLIEGGITFIVSGPGSGKTYLAMSIALDMATKYRDDIKVFYVDWDNPVTIPKDRGLPQKVLERGLERHIIYLNDLYKDWIDEKMKKLGKYEEVRRIGNKLKRCVKEINYLVPRKKKLVIFDSFQNFVDYNDDGVVRVAFQSMRKCINTTFLIIHHVNKQGSDKGLMRIKDSCDSMYFLESKHDNDNSIIEQTLRVDLGKRIGKIRFQTETEITFRYVDDLTFDVIEDVAISKTDEVVLRTAVKLLKERQYTQSQIVQAISEKVGVGRHKVRRILSRFTNKLFEERRGDKNAIYYSVIDNSDVMKLLFNSQMSKVKQKLFDSVIALIQAGKELEFPVSITVRKKEIKYPTLESIRDNIFNMKDDEAELVFDWLKLNLGK